MPKHDDDRPIERSARVKPRLVERAAPVQAKRSHIDPRFDNLYGSLNRNHYDQSYGFLKEKEREEHFGRLHRIKVLKEAAKRLREVEQVASDEEEQRASSLENEVRAAVSTLAPRQLEWELESLKAATANFQQKTKQEQALSREVAVKRACMRKEAADVLASKKVRPFFLKNRELKKEVERAKFDELDEKGGQGLVDKYVDRKRKRAVGGTR